jgi:uncharacterized repeat protein (TIGR03806 family)
MRQPYIWILLALFMAVVMACRKDKLEQPVGPVPPQASSPVVFDLDEVPYPTLSAYNFFLGPMVALQPVQGVLPYEVITPLFSDYALKKRFVWMPSGVQASYAGDHQALDFPDGAVLIKNFFYHNVLPGNATRVIETRLLYKRNGQWAFAEYVWNEDQTEAHLDMNGSFTQVDWIDEGGDQRTVNYRIPSGGECFTCHKQGLDPVPIGPKPQNLAMSMPYTDGVMDQLVKWTSVGYLAPGMPSVMDKVVRWDDPSAALDERVRAYIDMNCAHCHAEGSHCDYRPMRFAYTETADPVNLGVCVPPDEELLPALTHIVSRGNVERSMLHFRLNATDESVRMPLLGRTVVHEEAVELIEEWINSLTPSCN